jgi:hypothetical protein
VALLAEDNAALARENQRLVARGEDAASSDAADERRAGRDGRVHSALASLVRELGEENAALHERARGLAAVVESSAAAKAVEAAFGEEEGEEEEGEEKRALTARRGAGEDAEEDEKAMRARVAARVGVLSSAAKSRQVADRAAEAAAGDAARRGELESRAAAALRQVEFNESVAKSSRGNNVFDLTATTVGI